MVFEPFEGAFNFVRKVVEAAVLTAQPKNWHRPHFNFITCHYMYILGWALIGSIIVFPGGGLSYIDALFFTSGAATQAGLNTSDLNEAYLYQQIVLMFIACVANPIFINTSVVFVRLYWFEKRFEKVVQETRELRKSRAKTFSRSGTMRSERSLSEIERGVGGRLIRVLHETTKPNGMSGSAAPNPQAEKEFVEKLGLQQESRSVSPTPDNSNQGSKHDEDLAPDEKTKQEDEPDTPVSTYLGLPGKLQRDIVFADEVPTPSSGHALQSPGLEDIPESEKMALTPASETAPGGPEHDDRHIRFLEKQRNAKVEAHTLRIPGPRDFDRGEQPEELDDSDDELQRPITRNTLGAVNSEEERAQRLSIGDRSAEINGDDHPPRNITFNEPAHPDRRGPAKNVEDDNPEAHGFRHTLSKVKSNLGHKRNRSRSSTRLNLSDARGSMAKTFSTLRTAGSGSRPEEEMPYLTGHVTIGRNSAFLGLTEEQREELGGIEYRALKTLAKVLIVYFVGFHVFGMVSLLPWILHNQPWKGYVQSIGTSPGWWGVFTPASMFNDLGLTVTPDSMNSFNYSIWPLLIGSFLIIIGNTGFPCMLRFVIWVASKVTWRLGKQELHEELRFLLDHPRRCFTLLFPSSATWWLFWVLVGLNVVDLVFFLILDLNDDAVIVLPLGIRFLDGWFQATSTRTAGFSCINLAALHPAIQVSYLVMMYISVFPIAISVRRTNVYEEKSLGVWGGEEDMGEGEQSYVGQHLRRQLSFDLWYVFLGFFIICIIEGGRLGTETDYSFTMFSVLFEIVSAYGTVGLSLGYPGINASFSAEFKTLSKLIIIAMMIRGRHRGLPYALDRAIMLPSENLHRKDELAAAGMQRRMSSQTNWEDGDLDESGLPRQHTIENAMEAGAGGEHSPEGLRKLRRRGSAVTTDSRASGRDIYSTQSKGGTRRGHRRGSSFGTMLAGGMSAGPTLPRQ
ncbi:low affinity potassium transporter [Recurvomyces mirabilis]|nr:low affinity potassium transporter [Recurvomyces mirabilis]